MEVSDVSGGQLADHRVKSDDRIMEQVADRLAVEPEKAPAEIIRRLPDVIRYTFCIDTHAYVDGYHEITTMLRGQGHEMYGSLNLWADPEYKGINTRWVNSEGVRFEVQFHTVESYHCRQYMTREAHERIRDPRTCSLELAELRAYQRFVSSQVPVPDGAMDIPDYKKEGLRDA